MSILIFFLVLILLVIAHEFGHFIVAKKAGIRVDEFAFGFPPRLFAKKFGETTYSFNLLPLGGYVKIFGENPSDVGDASDGGRSFVAQPRYIQALVIVAGVVFNLLLSWILLTSIFMIGTPASPSDWVGYRVSDPRLTVVGVFEGSPAANARVAEGDVLLELTDGINTVQADSAETVTAFIAPRAGQSLTLTSEREGETLVSTITPESGIISGGAAIGVYMDTIGTLRLPPHMAFWEGGKRLVHFTQVVFQGTVGFFWSIFAGNADMSQVTGPIGLVSAVGDAADSGLTQLLLITALISISLAVINVLPFPALDGGRLLFILIEAIMHRAIPARVANYANIAGFALLMLLMIVVSWHDIAIRMN